MRGALLAVLLAGAAPAQDLSVSSQTLPAKPAAAVYRVGMVESTAVFPGRPRHGFLGLGRLFEEGKPLQMTVWSGGGAVCGSLAGPVGAAIGAAAGALVGLAAGR